MTFEECKNEYPIGSITGFFNVSTVPCTALAVKLMLKPNRSWALYNDFFINRDGEYYRVSPCYRACEGYVTQDGESFYAYTTEEGCFYSFSFPKEDKYHKSFFLIPKEGETLRNQLIKEWERQTSEKAIHSYETFMEDF